HAAQRPLICCAVVHAFIFPAILDQQIAALIIPGSKFCFVQRGNLGVQRGGHLPAKETGFAGKRPQPSREARLQRAHAFLGRMQHDVERLNQEGAGIRHSASSSSGAATNISPSPRSMSRAWAKVTHSDKSTSTSPAGGAKTRLLSSRAASIESESIFANSAAMPDGLWTAASST